VDSIIQIFGTNPHTLLENILHAEVNAVMAVLAASAALRIGTKVVAVTVVSIRREVRDVRDIWREISKK
jgi:hypothetical protein